MRRNADENTPMSVPPAGGTPPEAAPAVTPEAAPAETRLRRFWREWVWPLVVVLAVMGSVRSVLADWNDVPSGSMKPTIVEGDRIFVNKAAYGLRVPFTRWRIVDWAKPERGDIVVLFSPDDGKRLVKRVVGLPEDLIEMRRGRLHINGRPVRYGPIDPELVASLEPDERTGHRFETEELGGGGHPVMLETWPGTRGYFGPVKVPESHYFVMGDNRFNSRDSRVFGFVDRSAIVGKATAVVLSVDKEDYYRPRWERFFHRLR